MAKFQNCLHKVLDRSSAPSETVAPDALVGSGNTGSGSGDGGAGSGEPSIDFKVFDSIDALKASVEITTQCISEVSGVEILKGKNGDVFLVCASRRILPKNTLVGGFGTGR